MQHKPRADPLTGTQLDAWARLRTGRVPFGIR